MRFSSIISVAMAFATTAFAVPQPGPADSISLEARSAAPAAAALPYAEAAPAPVDGALVNALIKRSLEERQDLGALIADLGPILAAVTRLVSSQSLNNIIAIVNNAATIIDGETTPIIRGLIIQANRLITPDLVDLLVNLLNAVGPVCSDACI